MRMEALIAACLLSLAASSFAGPPKAQSNRQEISVPGVVLKTYETPYYYFHTDLAEDDAKEAALRMTKMFDMYRARTAELFKGQINQKLSFYLFSRGDDYYAAGGMPGSAGVFDGQKLMAMAIRDRNGKIGVGTWHVVQHEGFHQFVAYIIQGQIPPWVNEGLAEYFGESLFTGDGMITGIIDNGRLHRVQLSIKSGQFKTVKQMMLLTHEEWNDKLDIANYDQAWSMVHFLAAGDDGKYRDTFAQFLQLIGRGQPWARAWTMSFGTVEGFEDKWKAYWLKLPDQPTINLYGQVDVATLTSFVGRAYTQRQTFDNIEELLGTDATALKSAQADWLPPQLFDEMKGLSRHLQGSHAILSLEHGTASGPPRIICTMPDGTKIVGSFDVAPGMRIARVLTNVTKAAVNTANAIPKPGSATASTKPARN